MKPLSKPRAAERLDPVKARFYDRYFRMVVQWTENHTNINAARDTIGLMEQRIESLEADQAALREDAQKLQAAALLMDFDLFELARSFQAAEEASTGPPAPVPAIERAAPRPADDFSVKDFVLRWAKEQYPEPVRAAEIREQVLAFGHDIHPKTIGMSLYRWSLKGCMRRQGKADWYYVPESEREAGASVDDEHAEYA